MKKFVLFIGQFFVPTRIGLVAFLCFSMVPHRVQANTCQYIAPRLEVNTPNPTFSVSSQCFFTNLGLVVRDLNGNVLFSGGTFRFDYNSYTYRMSPSLDLTSGTYEWNVKNPYTGIDHERWVQFEVRLPVNWYLDNDRDGYGDADVVFPTKAFDSPTDPENPDDVYVRNNTDCDDSDNSIHPGAIELCNDGVDQDCNGTDIPCTTDQDGDGWRVETGDCNDNDASIHPGASEICNDGIDQDCFGGDLSCVSAVCSQISDTPLASGFSAPPNLMVVWDNSGSMDWAFSTTEAYGGIFKDYKYVFKMPDNVYSGELYGAAKRYWRARWHGYNRLYYNPAVEYKPWPNTEKYPDMRAFVDWNAAEPNRVYSHPAYRDRYPIYLSSTYSLQGDTGIDIVNAHYFEVYGGEVYLVQLTGGAIKYYKLPDPSSSTMYDGPGSPVAQEVTGQDIPPITQRSYLEERQNFANWFAFHRKRHYSAVSAFASMVTQLAGMNIGIYTINDPGWPNFGIRLPVVPINVYGENESDTLLNALYELNISPSETPLRAALRTVGEYFDDTDNIEPESLGASPYASEDDGGACQHSVALLVTDGYWNGIGFWGIGDTDNDGWGNTLADVAMYYYYQDLSSLPDKHYTTSWDASTRQHMLTYGIVMNLRGFKATDDYPGCPDNCDSLYPNYGQCDVCPQWSNPNVRGDGPVKIDDVWHATLNGRGQMYTVSEPQELANAFLNIAASIVNLGRSGSSLTVNGPSLTTNSTLYQSFYRTEAWAGDVKAYRINSVTGNVNPGYAWSASEELAKDLEGIAWWSSGRGRKIFTNTGSIGIPFNRSRQGAIGLKTEIINYIRGDDSMEGTGLDDFRQREDFLGDIVNSSPHYVNNTVFVGANDGMLHAFSGATGKEVFAYVPKAVIPNLGRLAAQEYVHTYYVDRTPYSRRISNDTTYLVGGLGKGGKAYYCLDISLSNLSPSSEAEAATNIFHWEFSPTGDGDLGYTYSQAYIVKVRTSNEPNSEPTWAVVFGNGYESENGRAVLYVLRLSDGSVLRKIDTQFGNPDDNCNGLSSPALIDGNADGIVDYAYAGDLMGNMWKFDLSGGDPDTWKVAFNDLSKKPKPLFRAMNKNGHGQPITAKPDVILSCDKGKSGYLVVFGTGKLLGKSDVVNGSTQSLYGIWDWADEWARVGRNVAERNTADKYLGEFQTSSDGTRTLSNIASLSYLSSKARGVGLVAQHQVHSNNDSVRVITDNKVTWYSIQENSKVPRYHVGWVLDFPHSRERLLHDIRVKNNVVLALSTVPVTDPCGTQSKSIIMELDACTGGRTNSPRLDINGDRTVDQDDLVLVDDPNAPGGRISVAASGINFDDTVYLPVILTLEDNVIERKYFSTADGTIITVDEAAEKLGLYYWKEVD